MDTRCSCCRDTQLKTLDHLFTTSDLVIKVWNYVTRPLGITHNANTVYGVLDYWWQTNATNEVHKMLLHVTPFFALWEIWKTRNANRYDGKNISLFRIISQILFNVQVAISKKYSKMDSKWRWSTICLIAENYKPKITSIVNEQAASFDVATSSESVPVPRNEDPTPVAGELNRWCVEGQWKIYKDAKMKNDKAKMARLITKEHRVLTGSLHTVPDIHHLFNLHNEKIVREFYAFYAATLRGLISKQSKPIA
ncbi:hypothetical protein H5410_062040 [Solanum commersonii]|uniref:Uncharacterized protein n=1 Tax=Solanum commersonii TaxID=4109 RepID=A0A9J5W9N3_SOLCO|nr:hypothetical protein H5410_062040 [Solanum commersonii]